MARVVFSPRAQRQLQGLFAFLAPRAGSVRARAYVRRVIAACRRLDHFPERGTRRDEIMPGLRTLGFERRVTIAFTIEGNSVIILGVFYGGQDYEAALRKGDERE
jgi:toxin ParE1/3/4